jgi:hypothetical protein
VENRIKIGISNSTNCLRRHIWYVKQGNNRRQMPSLYSWRMEKLIVTIMYCSILPMMQMDQNIECIVLSKRI